MAEIAYQKQKLHIAITILVMAIIFLHSAMPGDLSSAGSNIIVRLVTGLTQLPDETVSLITRKTAHFTEYMILGICFAVNVWDWKRKRSADLSGVKMVAIPWLLSSLYAVTDEIHQAFVPDRACALMDVGIDSAGALFGCIMILIIWKNSRRVK